MCLLGLSSVLKGQTLSYNPDVVDVNHKYLFNWNMIPRISNINEKYFRILCCRNEAFSTFSSLLKFIQIILYYYYPQFRKEKKSNLSQTSSAWKMICLKLPKMESLASKFNKGKQSRIEFKPCLKHLFASSKVSSLLPQKYHFILIVSNLILQLCLYLAAVL